MMLSHGTDLVRRKKSAYECYAMTTKAADHFEMPFSKNVWANMSGVWCEI